MLQGMKMKSDPRPNHAWTQKHCSTQRVRASGGEGRSQRLTRILEVYRLIDGAHHHAAAQGHSLAPLSQSALQQQFCRVFDARRGIRGHHSVRKDTLLKPGALLLALAFHLICAPRFRRSAFDVALAGSKPRAAQSELRDKTRRACSSLTSEARGRRPLLCF